MKRDIRLPAIGRRVCAVAAAGSAVLHGFALVPALGHPPSRAAAVLMVAMVAACLYCASDLWTRGTVRAWILVASMNLVMVALHAPTAPTPHHGGGLPATSPAHLSMVMTLATGLAVVEVVVAATVVFWCTRTAARSRVGEVDVAGDGFPVVDRGGQRGELVAHRLEHIAAQQ